MLKNIRDLLAENNELSAVFRRNLVKEYLQTLALAFIYSRKEFSGLIFYGGSALKHCEGKWGQRPVFPVELRVVWVGGKQITGYGRSLRGDVA